MSELLFQQIELASLMIHSDAKGGLDISYSLTDLEHLSG